jgi:hypothetical protein
MRTIDIQSATPWTRDDLPGYHVLYHLPDDAIVVDSAANAQPTADKLALLYLTADALRAAVLAVRPAYPVTANAGTRVDPDSVMPGSAQKGDPIRYDGAPGTEALHVGNLDHPYFGLPPAQAEIIKTVVKAAAVAGVPVKQYVLETARATVDPVTMRTAGKLLSMSDVEINQFDLDYHDAWGWQAPDFNNGETKSPKNPEAADHNKCPNRATVEAMIAAKGK